jgi:hypothetical protein
LGKTLQTLHLEFSSANFCKKNAKRQGGLSEAYWRQKEKKGLAPENPKKRLRLKTEGGRIQEEENEEDYNIRRICISVKKRMHTIFSALYPGAQPALFQWTTPLPPPLSDYLGKENRVPYLLVAGCPAGCPAHPLPVGHCPALSDCRGG